MNKNILQLGLCLSLLLTGCHSGQSQMTTPIQTNSRVTVVEETQAAAKSAASEPISQKLLGGLTPEAAIEYMKKTPQLVIVQVNTSEWKITPGFTNALWIPHNEMATRYNEIPKGCPVILHCGAGVVSVPAYKTLIEKRPDIPELSYIAGSPHSIIPVYNEWLKNK